ncbi:MAG: helix-turn-helix domain-containing protein [bacterium]
MSENGSTHYGAWIRERREERDLTLEEVSGRIRIDAKYLRALERGNIALLPEPYMRAFLKTYASFLGLDAGEASRRFESFVQEQRERDEKVRSAVKEKDSRRYGPAPLPHEPVPQTTRETERGNSSAWLWALAVVVLFAASGYLAWTLTRKSEELPAAGGQVSAEAPVEEASPPVTEVIPPDETEAAPAPGPEERPAEEARAAAGPAAGRGVFEAVGVDSTWLQVSWGETIYVSRVVPPGGRVRVPVSDTLEVKSGRSGGMRYYFDGEEITPVWPEGRVLTLLLTRDGVARRRWSLPPEQSAESPPDRLNIPPLP